MNHQVPAVASGFFSKLLERTIAYDHVISKVAEISYATNKKREQRKERSNKVRGDYIAGVNKKDKEAKRAIKTPVRQLPAPRKC